ncbi:hypothetical protein FB45DRAFT_1148623 [Roridomyces roridus]|uniref:F-box domain-containing protein n=1 Tax=Roridomyces roridus TaxID=1738132 RepID=A0AAD7FMV2_9AGAR|nr:hypothetical protein FB45DRAFT_1148623 [Roridomyces roridus]
MSMNVNSPSLFKVQELVDYCIDFLCDSRPDLQRCALVCRSWVRPAQRLLFRNWTFLDGVPDSRRLDALEHLSHSPELLHATVRLQTRLSFLDEPNFSALLPHLRRLRELHVGGVSPWSTSALSSTAMVNLGALLDLPLIQRVELAYTYLDLTAFLRIWDGCSKNIKHLVLKERVIDGGVDIWESLPSSGNRVAEMHLDSLDISDDDIGWLATDAFPFGLSQLTTLSLTVYSETLFDWSALGIALATIESLELALYYTRLPDKHIQLDAMTRLRTLTFRTRSIFGGVLACLSTVPPNNTVTTVRMFPRHRPPNGTLVSIDSLLATFPMLEKVGIEWAWGENDLFECLQELRSRELLSVSILPSAPATNA